MQRVQIMDPDSLNSDSDNYVIIMSKVDVDVTRVRSVRGDLSAEPDFNRNQGVSKVQEPQEQVLKQGLALSREKTGPVQAPTSPDHLGLESDLSMQSGYLSSFETGHWTGD